MRSIDRFRCKSTPNAWSLILPLDHRPLDIRLDEMHNDLEAFGIRLGRFAESELVEPYDEGGDHEGGR